MTTFDLRLPAAALGVALALAACSKDGQSTAENTTAAPASAEASATDPGRGAMLNARIDTTQAAVAQAVAGGSLAQDAADRLNGELVGVRGDLSAALTANQGPIPAEQRQALADRIAKVEGELAAAAPAAHP